MSTAGGPAINPDSEPVLKTENLMTRLGNCENRRFRLSIEQLNHFAKQQADTSGRELLIWIGPGWPELSGPEFRPDTPASRSFPAASQNEASARSLALPVLARLTGGRVLERSMPVSAAIAACIADANSSYVLSFDTAPAATPGEFHSLDVKVSKPGLAVRTTPAYYNQP
jgi:hypothetical protein